MHRFTKRKGLLAIGLIVSLAVAGGAYAYWTGTGSGTGTANVGTSGTVAITATVSDGVAPGVEVPVSFTAANASESPIQVNQVSLDTITVDGGHSGCETDDFSMGTVTEGHEVPAGATAEALPVDSSLVYANTGVNQDACKGATLTLNLLSN